MVISLWLVMVEGSCMNVLDPFSAIACEPILPAVYETVPYVAAWLRLVVLSSVLLSNLKQATRSLPVVVVAVASFE